MPWQFHISWLLARSHKAARCALSYQEENTIDALVLIEAFHVLCRTNNNGSEYLENVTDLRQCTFQPNLLGYYWVLHEVPAWSSPNSPWNILSCMQPVLRQAVARRPGWLQSHTCGRRLFSNVESRGRGRSTRRQGKSFGPRFCTTRLGHVRLIH